MQEQSFEKFLLADPSITSTKAVFSRISKARKAENILNQSLDTIVSDDDLMFYSLIKLQNYEDPAHNPMQNAVRKYYIFINKNEFPRLNDYRYSKYR